jgi:Domain of unknown function (DUF4157)
MALIADPTRKAATKAAPARSGRAKLAPQVPRPPWARVQLKAAGDAAATAEHPPRSNPIGLPNPLKEGLEAVSGLAMDEVRVHRNSAEPEKLGALAYARGNDIHLGPGQEEHLPHEAWHVIQQKQGRVLPTARLQRASINDDSALEQEADRMGAKALRTTAESSAPPARTPVAVGQPAQLKRTRDYEAALTKKWYASEIKSTGTEKAVEALAQSMSKNSEDSGVYVSDEKDWHESYSIGGDNDVARIVVPDLAHFVKDPGSLDPKLRWNGLTVGQNCALVAEHELIHLRQATQNAKNKLKGAPTGARTPSAHFTDQNIEKTVGDLLDKISKVSTTGYGTFDELTPLINYLSRRINYILSTWKDKKSNAEAPAVLRELRRYLDLHGRPSRLAVVYSTIVELERDCMSSLEL